MINGQQIEQDEIGLKAHDVQDRIDAGGIKQEPGQITAEQNVTADIMTLQTIKQIMGTLLGSHR